MRSRNPFEQPAPSLVAVALVASRCQQRRLSRRLLRRVLPRAPTLLFASPSPRAIARRLRVAVLARVLERLQHARDDRLVRRDRQVLGVVVVVVTCMCCLCYAVYAVYAISSLDTG